MCVSLRDGSGAQHKREEKKIRRKEEGDQLSFSFSFVSTHTPSPPNDRSAADSSNNNNSESNIFFRDIKYI